MIKPRKEFMEAAISEALKTREKGDYAIGAVIAKGDTIIVRVGNMLKRDNDPTNHAEMVAIREAAKLLGSRYLDGCVLYTTHEPCPMCAGAAIWAKMDGIVFGAKMEDISDFKAKHGNNDWQWRTIKIPASTVIAQGDPKLALVEGFMRDECKRLFHC